MTLTYRDGRPGDGEVVSALFCRAFTETFGTLYSAANLNFLLGNRTASWFEDRLANPDWAFQLAEEDGALIGYAMVGPNELPGDLPGPTLELHHLYLDASAKGRGIADRLFDWSVGQGRQRGFTFLALSVFIDNHRARRFYEKRGMIEVGQYDFMVGDHVDDDRVMRLTL